ncbi:MAG: hypothetical protein WC858_02445 [Parcubacteria group bacterium]|jgi:hypothetical protein
MTDQSGSGAEGLYCLNNWKKEKVFLPVKNWITAERDLTYTLEVHSIICLDGMITIELDFTGGEDKLWQLEKYVDYFNLFHILTLLNIKPWAKARNIPCKIGFHWKLSRRCVSYFFRMIFGLALIKIAAYLSKL